MANYGLKISKDGYSVMTADETELSFSSEFNLFKEFMSGTGTVTVPEGAYGVIREAEIEITHALGYRPVYFLFGTAPGAVPADMIKRYPTNNAASFECVYAISKTNTLLVRVRDATHTEETDYEYKYFIVLDSAE